MMKSLIVALCVFFLTACYDKDAGAAGGSALMKDTLIIQTQDGNKHTFNIELALSPLQLEKGLMGRTDLAPDSGMLFWFGGQERNKSFWMKNTLIPLDMIFIKKDGTIYKIHAQAQPHDLTGIPSEGPIAAVLEIPGGRAEELGLRSGDRVKQRFFK